MEELTAMTRAYYEAEARARTRRRPEGRRVEERQAFVALLAAEHRSRIIDFGAGPGGDGPAFVEAGLAYTGIDLAHANAVLARADGLHVVQGSVVDPPFRGQAFDAGWCMSVLMHLERDMAQAAVVAMADVLSPGSPLVVGVWGGPTSNHIDEEGIAGHRRLFARRPLEDNRAMLATVGEVEVGHSWPGFTDQQDYQLFRVRIG